MRWQYEAAASEWDNGEPADPSYSAPIRADTATPPSTMPPILHTHMENQWEKEFEEWLDSIEPTLPLPEEQDDEEACV